jgi:hypothetical protein
MENDVKQTPADRKKANLPAKAGNRQKLGGRGSRSRARIASSSSPDPKINDLSPDQIASDRAQVDKIRELPREVGVMLITAGIVGLILPGPGTPAIIAGGLALWPKAFGKLESWLEQRYPNVHHQSMKQIGRFLNDLEKRYPYSTHE